MKIKTVKTTFQQLKKNQLVQDTWYGLGSVIKKTQRSAYIKLFEHNVTWRYDAEHVKHFIKLIGKGK